MSENQETVPGNSGKIVSINEAEISSLLDRKVRESVEETINGLLDAEADALCHAVVVSRIFRTLAFVRLGLVGFSVLFFLPGKAGVRWRRREWVTKLVGADDTAARPGRSRRTQPAVAASWLAFSW